MCLGISRCCFQVFLYCHSSTCVDCNQWFCTVFGGQIAFTGTGLSNVGSSFLHACNHAMKGSSSVWHVHVGCAIVWVDSWCVSVQRKTATAGCALPAVPINTTNPFVVCYCYDHHPCLAMLCLILMMQCHNRCYNWNRTISYHAVCRQWSATFTAGPC